MMRDRGAVVIIDASWLTPHPSLILSSGSTRSGIIAAAAAHASARRHHRIISRRGRRGAHDPARPCAAHRRSGRHPPGSLYAVRPDSVYTRVGLANGDTVHTINGVAVDSPNSLQPGMLLIHQRLEIELTRRGKPVSLFVEIED
jgi:hypothetical protein